MSSSSFRSSVRSRLLVLAPFAGMFALAACREPTAGRPVAQDSVVVALPTLAVSVEVVPAVIALGDTATVRVTVTNRSTTPVKLDLGCGAAFSYRIETLAGEVPPGVSRTVCVGSITRVRFGPGEVRVAEIRLPRPGGENTAVGPGEYRVLGTFAEIPSAPVRLLVTPGR
jgi:hypothetical protein